MLGSTHACHLSNQEIALFTRQLSEISARIVRVSNKDLDEEINLALQQVLQTLGVDRGGLLEVDSNSSVLTVSHAWYGEGIERVAGNVNLAELFPWSYQKVVLEGRTLAVDDPVNLPAEAAQDRESHRALGNLSTLTIPLFIGDRVHHLITIDAHKKPRQWPIEIIANMRLLGEVFVSALHRRESDYHLSNAKARLDLAAASANAALWELDFATGCFWVNDKARQLFGYATDDLVTLDNFLERVHSEDRPKIVVALEGLSKDQGELNLEYRSPDPEGGMRWMHSRGRLITPNGTGSHLLTGITLDISRFKAMEEQLQRQLHEIEQLQRQVEKENLYLRSELAQREDRKTFSGFSHGMQNLMAQIEQVATTDSTVMIQGETGTGKELVAQTIHELSDRSHRVMVKVNCAALPAALVESELFGREKGAFTGALSKQAGRFELADGSTIFLDEIAEMPLETQVKLLRVLQEGEFERLGSPRTIKVNVRVITASNRDLAEEVRQGRFRRDLYYRLNVFPIQVPPLRERPEEIPNLVWEFVNEFGERMGKKVRRISQADMDWLNIRELRNVIEHALIVSQGDTLELQRPSDRASCQTQPTTLEDVERRHIQNILTATQGRIKGANGAAERLGLPPSTLYSRMRKLGMTVRPPVVTRDDITP